MDDASIESKVFDMLNALSVAPHFMNTKMPGIPCRIACYIYVNPAAMPDVGRYWSYICRPMLEVGGRRHALTASTTHLVHPSLYPPTLSMGIQLSVIIYFSWFPILLLGLD